MAGVAETCQVDAHHTSNCCASPCTDATCSSVKWYLPRNRVDARISRPYKYPWNSQRVPRELACARFLSSANEINENKIERGTLWRIALQTDWSFLWHAHRSWMILGQQQKVNLFGRYSGDSLSNNLDIYFHGIGLWENLLSKAPSIWWKKPWFPGKIFP